MKVSGLLGACFALLLAFAATAEAAPALPGGEDGIYCQERDKPPRPPRGERPEREDERTGPDRPDEVRRQMERLRREIEELRKKAELAKRHGEPAMVEDIMQEIKERERRLREMERRMRPGPERPRREGPPGPSPDEMEEIKREIQRLHEEARKAKERGDPDEAEELLRRAEEFERRLHRPEGPPPEREFSEEDMEKVVGWLEENEPETLEKLERLREHNPEAYYHFLRETFEKMMHMAEMQKRDPEGYKRMTEIRKLDRLVWELAEKHKHADSAEQKAEIAAKLEKTLSRMFDLKQAQHKAEIENLEKEVAKLKEIYDTNQQNKEAIIKERLRKLTGKNHSFDW